MVEQKRYSLPVTSSSLTITSDQAISLVLEPVFRKVKPPLVESERMNLSADYSLTIAYESKSAKLPPEFEEITEAFNDSTSTVEPTHISRLNRPGSLLWASGHEFLWAFRYNLNEVPPLQPVRILRARRVRDNKRGEYDYDRAGARKEEHRAKLASQKGQTPKFRL